MRSGKTSWRSSALNATRSPTVSEPSIASLPPTYSTVTSATIGNRSSIGLNVARSLPSATASTRTCSARPSSNSFSTCSAPKPLTTRMPATPSSTTSETSASRSCRREATGSRSFWNQAAPTASSGKLMSASSVSLTLRVNSTPRIAMTMTTFAAKTGTNTTSWLIWRRSRFARAIRFPIWARS